MKPSDEDNARRAVILSETLECFDRDVDASALSRMVKAVDRVPVEVLDKACDILISEKHKFDIASIYEIIRDCDLMDGYRYGKKPTNEGRVMTPEDCLKMTQDEYPDIPLNDVDENGQVIYRN